MQASSVASEIATDFCFLSDHYHQCNMRDIKTSKLIGHHVTTTLSVPSLLWLYQMSVTQWLCPIRNFPVSSSPLRWLCLEVDVYTQIFLTNVVFSGMWSSSGPCQFCQCHHCLQNKCDKGSYLLFVHMGPVISVSTVMAPQCRTLKRKWELKMQIHTGTAIKRWSGVISV